MATVVEIPVSALSAGSSTLSHQRRPSTVEVIDVDQIIDVDELDEYAPSTSSRHLPRAPSREIIVIDSDDEGPSQGEASGSNGRPGPRHRLLSPPPPSRAPSHPPPPVPRVPHRFSAFTGFVPPRDNAGTPPVIRPIERPFEFGNIRPIAAIPEHPNRHRRVPYVELRAEPEPHHVPALGLGGAIVAVNDHRTNRRGPQANVRRRLHNHIPVNDEPPGILGRMGHAMGQTVRRLYTTWVDRDELADDPLGYGLNHFGNGEAFGFLEDAALQDVIFRRRGPQRPPEAEYKVEYTHPEPPEPGFTFHFAPPDTVLPTPKPAPIVIDLVSSDSEDAPVAGSSKQKEKQKAPIPAVKTDLVCARCLDSLVLGGGLVGDEGRQRKVWALRCGHMIDGKCLDIIGSPNENSMEEPPLVGKGKGKAKEVNTASTDILASAENTVRSRLRSRVPPPPVPNMEQSSPSTSSPTTLGKRKRNTKPRIEATYEWKCPVTNCGRVHASVKMDGTWIPEPANLPSKKGKGKRIALEPQTYGRGAIAVFV